MSLKKVVVIYLNAYIQKLCDMKQLLGCIEKVPLQETDVKRLDMRIVQLEQEAEKYDRLKVSAYEDLKEELITKEEYFTIKQEFETRRRDALDSIAQIRLEMDSLLKRNGKHHEWIENFTSKGRIESLTRNVVIELINQIRVYEDKRIEIIFRYSDKYDELVSLINSTRNSQADKDKQSLQEVS